MRQKFYLFIYFFFHITLKINKKNENILNICIFYHMIFKLF